MPLSHLMLGLFSGLLAVALAVAMGLPIWMAALLYVGVGNLALVSSMMLELWADDVPRPPRQRALAPRRAARLLHAGH